MSKQQIKQLIADRVSKDGMTETGVQGVQLFRITEPIQCAPAVYEPSVVAIINGAKEAILDGKRYEYDSSQYMCCAMPMPVEAGAPVASKENPLLGIYISLDTRVMTELAIEMERAAGAIHKPGAGTHPQGVVLARWDSEFTEALLRLLQLGDSQESTAILGAGRLREVYYAILKGEAGDAARRAFGVGNEIARAIEYVSSRLAETVTIEDVAAQARMSRAVFHRKFKQATTIAPIQPAHSMRSNNAPTTLAGTISPRTALGHRLGIYPAAEVQRRTHQMLGAGLDGGIWEGRVAGVHCPAGVCLQTMRGGGSL